MKALTLTVLISTLLLVGGCAPSTQEPGSSATPVETTAQQPIAGTVVVFSRRGSEWSLPAGGELFGERDAGYAVKLLRLEGRRLRVLDPGTNGEAYVDLEDLAIPTSIEGQIRAQLASVSRTVVALVARPGGYAHSRDAVLGLATWIEKSASDGDQFSFLWMDDVGVGRKAEIVPSLQLPAALAAPVATSCAYGDSTCNAGKRESDQQRRQHDEEKAQLVNSTVSALRDAAGSSTSGDMALADSLTRGADLLHDASGERWLIIASPLPTTENAPKDLSLDGLQVRWIFPDCRNEQACRQNATDWTMWAASAQANLRVVDPSADLGRGLF
jgi:hypothetical protein